METNSWASLSEFANYILAAHQRSLEHKGADIAFSGGAF
jgi:CheY-specific phosphatase CheX